MLSPHARQLAYLANARSLGLRWRSYISLAGIVAGTVAIALIVPDFRFMELYVGFMLGAVTMLVALSIARFDDPQMRGHLAEQWSVEALGKRTGWQVIDNVPFDRVDVDHVAVTPSSVLAVETKYHGRIQPGSQAEAARHERDLRDAKAAATKVRSFLRSRKLHDVVVVAPVLMIWGAGAPKLPKGHRLVDGVHIVDGNHTELWSHLFNAPLLTSDRRNEVHTAFTEFLEKRRVHESARHESLRRRMWHELRAGIAEERATRAARTTYRKTLERRHSQTRMDDAGLTPAASASPP